MKNNGLEGREKEDNEWVLNLAEVDCNYGGNVSSGVNPLTRTPVIHLQLLKDN